MNKTENATSQYVYTVAGRADNADILRLLHKSPIRMEMDYVMDRQGDFFRLHRLLPGSVVLLARDRENGTLEGFLTMLKSEGRMGDKTIGYQYVTDLVKSTENRSPLLMKRLMNYGLEHHFDTPFIFGLVNAQNKAARFFSTSSVLQYPGAHAGTFNYLEMAPLWRQKVPKKYSLTTAQNEQDIALALECINRHYQHHVLFQPLSLESIQRQFDALPGFAQGDIWLLRQNETVAGAMITYRPARLSSLIIERMDTASKWLFGAIRVFHRITGLLFDPPKAGEHINTLQVRYLAGNDAARKALLNAANNTAYQEKLHSVSMFIDERDRLEPDNWVVYRYQSFMYANGKSEFPEYLSQLQQHLIFMDITMG